MEIRLADIEAEIKFDKTPQMCIIEIVRPAEHGAFCFAQSNSLWATRPLCGTFQRPAVWPDNQQTTKGALYYEEMLEMPAGQTAR